MDRGAFHSPAGSPEAHMRQRLRSSCDVPAVALLLAAAGSPSRQSPRVPWRSPSEPPPIGVLDSLHENPPEMRENRHALPGGAGLSTVFRPRIARTSHLFTASAEDVPAKKANQRPVLNRAERKE
ncbi:hypothetical protein Sfum_2667 [Syntrophobacter fumaroxidans MPOB]|uniref:Uncharacterized protein n=1 Tax=Syntrophobacter fumaroxidans (strain DSM 10017 / MPOB) TaxID=335543 RepID=A0LLP3_SYNFM|nr:hypothetical protein Sfum_2667 [Syntrophobacter fumaroxidans MPOB]